MKSHRTYANFQSAQVPQQVARPLKAVEYIHSRNLLSTLCHQNSIEQHKYDSIMLENVSIVSFIHREYRQCVSPQRNSYLAAHFRRFANLPYACVKS